MYEYEGRSPLFSQPKPSQAPRSNDCEITPSPKHHIKSSYLQYFLQCPLKPQLIHFPVINLLSRANKTVYSPA